MYIMYYVLIHSLYGEAILQWFNVGIARIKHNISKHIEYFFTGYIISTGIKQKTKILN